MTKAIDDMIVDHPRRLHEGVADGRSDKAKSALFQGPAHGVRFRACCGDILQRPAGVNLRLAANKLAYRACEAAALPLDGSEGGGVAACRLRLHAIADGPP